MATKRRRKAATRRRRRVVRRSPVQRLRRHAVYLTNRGKKRRYRRNPRGFRFGGIGGQVVDLVKGSAAILVGQGLGRTVGGLIPIGDPTQPVVQFAKGAAVAIAIRTLGGRFVSPELARLAAYGAMAGATKNLAIAFFPQAEGFLGAADGVMALPRFPYQPRLQAYSEDGGEVYDGSGDLSSYSEVYQ